MKLKDLKESTVFVIIGIMDAILMIILFPIYYITPEFYSNNFNSDAGMIPELAILEFNDYFLELNSLVTALDITMIMGLLSAKKIARKIVIGSAISLLLFSLSTFAIPGLILYSVLIWYMFRRKTREYFEITNNKK